jgi:hypothetical protein
MRLETLGGKEKERRSKSVEIQSTSTFSTFKLPVEIVQSKMKDKLDEIRQMKPLEHISALLQVE